VRCRVKGLDPVEEGGAGAKGDLPCRAFTYERKRPAVARGQIRKKKNTTVNATRRGHVQWKKVAPGPIQSAFKGREKPGAHRLTAKGFREGEKDPEKKEEERIEYQLGSVVEESKRENRDFARKTREAATLAREGASRGKRARRALQPRREDGSTNVPKRKTWRTPSSSTTPGRGKKKEGSRRKKTPSSRRQGRRTPSGGDISVPGGASSQQDCPLQEKKMRRTKGENEPVADRIQPCVIRRGREMQKPGCSSNEVGKKGSPGTQEPPLDEKKKEDGHSALAILGKKKKSAARKNHSINGRSM